MPKLTFELTVEPKHTDALAFELMHANSPLGKYKRRQDRVIISGLAYSVADVMKSVEYQIAACLDIQRKQLEAMEGKAQ